MNKKINFKQGKYVLPLILMPFLIYLGYKLITLFSPKEENKVVQKELSTSLGKVDEKILSKNDAYDKFYKTRDNRTMLRDVGEEEQSEKKDFTDNLTDKERRYIDSLNLANKEALEKLNAERTKKDKDSYYEKDEDDEMEQSMKLIKMLNGTDEASIEKEKLKLKLKEEEKNQKKDDPVQMMREQMLLLDSLEKVRNPELKLKSEEEKRKLLNEKKKEEFLNSTFEVKKDLHRNGAFNHLTRKKQSNMIKAVIDENIKGYLGSRLRLRLLEDTYVGEHKITKGTFLYAQISGFDLQRVFLNIVSVMVDETIIPINLTIYDLDGMKGLYVPKSTFREMVRELTTGQNYLQNSALNQGNQSFYTNLLGGLLNSSSDMIMKIIRKNKVRLKFNANVLLVNERKLEKNNF